MTTIKTREQSSGKMEVKSQMSVRRTYYSTLAAEELYGALNYLIITGE
jgi:hypothetical protein